MRLDLAGIALFVILAQPASAQPPPGSTGEYHEWFQKQLVPDGSQRSCCAEADGRILGDDQWRVKDGEYQALIDGEWITFPNKGEGNEGNTVLGYTANPTGHPVAWLIGKTPRCLAPGTVS